MVALPPLDVSPTVEAIYAHYQRVGSAEPARPYLGGSIIGGTCERALYYTFRWATMKIFSGRMYRLFQTGHREEDRIINDLISIGLKVWSRNPTTGLQWSWSEPSLGHHYAGNADGICQGVIEAPMAAHLLECKTHSTKSFADLKAKKVKLAKPTHYAQVQQYMHWSIEEHGKTNGCHRALYVAQCKDTDEIYIERIEYDEAFALGLSKKAERIIFGSMPDRVNDDPSWYECKLCDHHPICHSDVAPDVNCRTCAYSTPERDPDHAVWTCGLHKREIGVDEQRLGCQEHRFLPPLLSSWAEATDMDDGSIQYRTKATGSRFWNGRPTMDGFTSHEIRAAQDKRALSHAEVIEIREMFDARISA